MHAGVYKAETESIEGTSASAKLGFQVSPASVKNLSVDGSVRGYAGQRQGVTCTLSVIWAFRSPS